jgi:Tol biopolymer transport system component
LVTNPSPDGIIRDKFLTLTAGTRVGVYQITAQIGIGGMGEVYRARDGKLQRDVAIKVLPDAFALDADRLARFEREARTLAALNHPNIAHIYGLEDIGGVSAIVMELVDGVTLADRIALGPIPIDEALPIAKQIADGLESAHEQGIVHRDLKPANVKVRNDGTVKVLDFGLAKALALETGGVPAANLSEVATITTPAIVTGVAVLIGTAAYMAPEQAKRKAVDARADIWAFGCVLFEMLAGRPAFGGDTVIDTLAQIVARDPEWSALPEATTPGIRRLLQRCLERDLRRRVHAAADVRIEIEDAIAALAVAPMPAASRRQTAALAAWLVAAVAVLAAVGIAVFPVRRVAELPSLRLEVMTPPTADPVSFALSPDGRQLVFAATGEKGSQLWLRPLDQTAAQPLPGTNGAVHPFWAPDGRAVGFFADGQVKRLDLDGGRPRTLAEARNGQGGAWNRDGVIIFAPFAASPLVRVPATGGIPVAVTQLAAGEGSHRFPTFLPDGRRFLFYVGLSEPNAEGVYIGSLAAADPRQRILASDTAAAYSPPGYLLMMRQNVLMAAPFDAKNGTLTGDAVPVASEVGANNSARGAFSVSMAGLLAHRRPWRTNTPRLTWINRDGTPAGALSAPGYPQLSPDGRRIAVARNVQGSYDIYTVETARGDFERLTVDPALELMAVWSPDSDRVVFSSNRRGAFDLFEKPVSRSRDEQLLLASPENKYAVDWSPDGAIILFVKEDPTTGDDLWALRLDNPRTPFPVLRTRVTEDQAQFSPDGHWIAYRSNESGQREIYLRPFPGPGGQRPVSQGGGSQPRWRRDGKELFYLATDDRLMVVPIRVPSENQTLEVGTPSALFSTRIAPSNNAQQQYTVAPDGQRFLINVISEEAGAPPITIVQNWTAPLRK